MALDASDVRWILDEVANFCVGEVDKRAARWEEGLTPQALHALMGMLTDMGVVPVASDAEVPGLWCDVSSASGMTLSLGVLTTIGRSHAGLAFACHRRALGAWLQAQLGGVFAELDLTDAALVTTGHHGLARGSLGRWLTKGSVGAEDDGMLTDWLGRPDAASVVVAMPDWRDVVWPVWRDGVVQWAWVRHDGLHVKQDAAPHGLSDLTLSKVLQREGCEMQVSNLSGDVARQVLSTVLKVDWLGLVAIGLGVTQRGALLAKDFAGLRRQGGATIDQHPAVQTMLGEIHAAERMVSGLLRICQVPVQEVDLQDVVTIRMQACEALVHANHQVIQVHGGVGYMRDAGPERLLRDQNMLRQLSGGVWGLPMALQALQEEVA